MGKKKKQKGGRKTAPGELAATALSYHGPVQTKWDKEQGDLHTFCFGFAVACSSDGTGTIANVYGSSPTGVADWSSLAAVFEEFRTLAFEVRYFPNNRYSKVSTTCTPLLGIVDRANNAAFASYNALMSHASHKRLSLEDPWVMIFHMSGSDEAEFQTTNSPTDDGWIKFFSTGLTASTTYGQFFITYRAQFRGRA
jgi:hypothetical protein